MLPKNLYNDRKEQPSSNTHGVLFFFLFEKLIIINMLGKSSVGDAMEDNECEAEANDDENNDEQGSYDDSDIDLTNTTKAQRYSFNNDFDGLPEGVRTTSGPVEEEKKPGCSSVRRK